MTEPLMRELSNRELLETPDSVLEVITALRQQLEQAQREREEWKRKYEECVAWQMNPSKNVVRDQT